nr:hypothetical protein CFP56_40511 [Quercus suber]
MAHVEWSSTLASIEVPVPVEMSVTPHPYIYEFVYRVGCKLDEDDDQKDESNGDEVDKEVEDKGLQDKKEDDESASPKTQTQTLKNALKLPRLASFSSFSDREVDSPVKIRIRTVL